MKLPQCSLFYAPSIDLNQVRILHPYFKELSQGNDYGVLIIVFDGFLE
jgi:hypothetical protein